MSRTIIHARGVPMILVSKNGFDPSTISKYYFLLLSTLSGVSF